MVVVVAWLAELDGFFPYCNFDGDCVVCSHTHTHTGISLHQVARSEGVLVGGKREKKE